MGEIMEYSIYLAGPITGHSLEDCATWREEVSDKFPPHIHAMDPLRFKSFLADEEHLKDAYEGSVLSCGRGITARDLFDVQRCDAVLCNLLETSQVSVGTMIELGAAHAWGKPVVGVIEADGVIKRKLGALLSSGAPAMVNPHYHAMVREIVKFWVADLDEGVEAVCAIVNPNCRFSLTN